LATVYLSPRAESDFLNIGDYTLRTWGPGQTVRYLSAIRACCQRLAEHPSIGRPCDELGAGLRRVEQGKHVVFYREIEDGILVARILHRSMLPERHDLDEDT
jgi:toxin ParE1/3/4